MAVIVKGDRISFPGGDQTAPGAGYDDLRAMRGTLTSPTHGRVSWGSHQNWDYRGEAYNVRGRYYVYRSDYGQSILLLDGYGRAYGSTGYSIPSGTDTISYYNSSGIPVKVAVRAWAGRWTDDGDYHIVYRGGSIANAYTHSGGTAIISAGGDNTYIDTIPAGTTYQYYHYSGIPGGSGGDQTNAYFTVSFYSFS